MGEQRRIERDRQAWEAKPVLRAIYTDLYQRMAAACRPGRTLEIGGGSGNLKDWLPGVVSTDIQFAPWLDAVADAQSLPFADGSFDNVVLFDVLHHIPCPRRFLEEAQRVLKPGGRVVMVEPGITPVSHLFFKLMHPEPVIMDEDPLADQPAAGRRDPYDANQGIPTLIFKRHRARFLAAFPTLEILRADWLSLLAYPLSGGFKSWSLMPSSLVPPMLRIEQLLMPLLGPLMSFRLLVVLESCPGTTGERSINRPA